MNKKYLIIGGLFAAAAVVVAQQTLAPSMQNGWKAWANYNTASYPAQVACSADGQTVFLVVRSDNPNAVWSAKLLKSTDGGQTWRLIQP